MLLGSKLFDTPRELVNANKIYRRLLAVAGPAITQRLGDQSWIAPGSLANGWVNAGGANAVVGYRVRDQILQLRGTIKSGALSTTTPLFTLPAGYIPDLSCVFLTVSNTGFARIDVRHDGGVYVNSYGNGGSAASVCLDGVLLPIGGTSNPTGRDMTVTSAAWPWASTPMPDGIVANAVAWYQKVFRPIDYTIAALDLDDTGWITLTPLTSSWVRFSGVDWPTPQYRIVRGTVWLRGMMKNGTTGIFASMPVGARPAKTIAWHTLADGAGAAGSSTEVGVAHIQMSPTGALTVNNFFYGGNNTYVSLGGMSWDQDVPAI